MMSLIQFQVSPPEPIFRTASILPSFFQSNLIDPARIVKVFSNDPQANIKVFYYQYLKLCFEVDTKYYQQYIQKIEELINNESFKFIFIEDDDPTVYNDLQFKRLIMEFFGVLSEGLTSIEKTLEQYPIMDTVFVYFFRTLLILTGRTDAIDSYIDREELFEYLAEYFGVAVSVHNKCWKFSETDIFAYEEDPREVYMAYMDYEQENIAQPQYKNQTVSAVPHLPLAPNNETQQANLQSSQQSTQQPAQQANLLPPREASVINQSYIASEFMDYTDPRNVPGKQLSSLLKNDLKKSNTMQDNKSGFQNFNQIINGDQKPVSKESKTDDKKLQGKEVDSHRVTTPINKIEDEFKFNSQNQVPSNFSSGIDKTIASSNYASKNANPHSYEKYNSQPQQNYKLPPAKTEAWQPTKDPGFDSNYGKNVIGPLNDGSKYANFNPQPSTYEFERVKTGGDLNSRPPLQTNLGTQNAYSSSSYQAQSSTYEFERVKTGGDASSRPPLETNYGLASTNTYSSYDYAKDYSKPIEPFQKSKLVDNYAYTSPYGENNDFLKKSPVYDQYQNTRVDSKRPSVSDPQPNYLTSGISNKKNPFGLNVSQQFTNSLTLKSVAEPYKSNITSIRSRARVFRNSLVSYMK